MIRIALLRHGRTPWNRAGQIQGRSDIPLDEEAKAELAGLSLPPPWNDAELWSSPLSRAVQTAELVGGHSPRIAPELMEMNWGAWEGKRGTDLIADPDSGYRHIEEWGMAFRPPGGESLQELSGRLAPWMDALTRDAVAVCHIGVMRVLLAQATGWAFEGPAPFRIKRNRLYVLTRDATGLKLDPEPVRLVPRESGS